MRRGLANRASEAGSRPPALSELARNEDVAVSINDSSNDPQAVVSTTNPTITRIVDSRCTQPWSSTMMDTMFERLGGNYPAAIFPMRQTKFTVKSLRPRCQGAHTQHLSTHIDKDESSRGIGETNNDSDQPNPATHNRNPTINPSEPAFSRSRRGSRGDPQAAPCLIQRHLHIRPKFQPSEKSTRLFAPLRNALNHGSGIHFMVCGRNTAEPVASRPR